MITKEQLKQDLLRLGVQKGDVLYIKASYKSIGKVDGGPLTVIDAICETVGNEGTVIFSAFLKGSCLPRRWFQKKEICDINSPTWNGVLSSMMLSYPNTVVTTHPMFRYCIWGRYSQELASFSSETYAPYDILKEKSENYKAKSLIIGEGTYGIGTTHISLTEALIKWNYNQRRINSLIYYRNKESKLVRYEDFVSVFCPKGLSMFTEKIMNDIIVGKGNIGTSTALLINMNIALNLERRILSTNPEAILCNDPTCFTCRMSYSFSEKKYFSFIFKSSDSVLYNIRYLLRFFLFSKKCR